MNPAFTSQLADLALIIHNGLENPAILDQANVLIKSLELSLSQAFKRMYIPPYTQASMQSQLSSYKAIVAAKSHKSNSNTGFKFKQSENVIIPLTKYLCSVQGTHNLPAYVNESNTVDSKTNNEYSNMQANSSHIIDVTGQSDIHLRNLQPGIVLILKGSTSIDACHLSNIHDKCVIMITVDITGSILLDSLSNCVLIFLGKCHQLRVHCAQRIVLASVYIASSPIIEQCSSITVVDISNMMGEEQQLSKATNLVDFNQLVVKDHAQNWRVASTIQTSHFLHILDHIKPALAAEYVSPQLSADLRNLCDLNNN